MSAGRELQQTMKRVERITFKMVKAEVSAANGLVGATAYFAKIRLKTRENVFLFVASEEFFSVTPLERELHQVRWNPNANATSSDVCPSVSTCLHPRRRPLRYSAAC